MMTVELIQLNGLKGFGGVAIATSASTLTSILPAQAQTLILDGTTGPAQTLKGPVYEVEQDLGTAAGGNLFHSFEQFDLGTDERANFRAAPEVRNILTRVTGGAASTIDGVLATPGSTADFYLINPAGVLFGPSGKLELGGSFIGTTASAVRFGEVGEFSAVQPQSTGLLSIAPSALIFAENAGRIASQSVAPARPSLSGDDRFGLEVSEGKGLLLVGGDIAIDGGGIAGGLRALGGRLELGGLASAGEIQLIQAGQTVGLQYPQDAELADVQISNNAEVRVVGTGGGDLVVNADRLEGTSGGQLVAGTGGAGDAGDLIINAREIEFRGGFKENGVLVARSGAGNYMFEGGTGNGGELRITGYRLTLSEGAQIGNSIFGTGSTGDVVLAIREAIELDGADGLTYDSVTGILNVTGIFNDLQNGSPQSKGGKLIIQTQRLDVRNGAQISTSLVEGQGESGAIEIDAQEIWLEGTAPIAELNLALPSRITSDIDADAIGQGGNITIQTDQLFLLGGANLSTRVVGTGQGGAILINAEESIEISGQGARISTALFPDAVGESGKIRIVSPRLSLSLSGFISSDSFGGIGNAGDIQIEVGKLEMSQLGPSGFFSGGISSGTNGNGNAGEILISAKDISLKDNGNISSSRIRFDTEAGGNGGDIIIQTESLELVESLISSIITGDEGQAGDISLQIEEDAVLRFSDIVTSVDQESSGSGGNIAIEAGALSLLDSSLRADTLGAGNAGSISLQSRGNIELQGENTTVSTASFFDMSGSASDIQIKAKSLSVTQGASVFSFTGGKKDAGNIEIETSENIFVEQSQIDASTIGAGAGGDILLRATEVVLTDGSLVRAQSRGMGSVSSINVQADTLKVQNDSGIFFNALSPEASIDGGEIDLDLSSTLLLRNDSAIFATASDQTPQGGSGGAINIAAPFVIGIPGKNGDISTSGIGGDGGHINIDAEGVFNFKLAPQNGPTAAELRQNSDNDISSNSQVTQGGSVLVSGLNVDPTQGAAELPTNFTDPSQQIAQSCARTANRSSFINTGRNGIPLNPTDAQTLSNTEADWAALPPARAIARVQVSPAEPAAASTEVTHWQRDPEGNIVLLATQPVRPTFDLAHC